MHQKNFDSQMKIRNDDNSENIIDKEVMEY
jgi:hypothetical protein